MGSEWVKCTLADAKSTVFVNLAVAISIRRGTNTQIAFAGPGADVLVVETPEELLKQLEDVKRAANWMG
jgi:hypothetical protein